MTNKIKIATNAAPPATGTYSQAIRIGDLVFVTGQTGRDPDTGKLEEGLDAQARRMLSNVAAILERRRLLPCGHREGDAAARGHQGFQSRRSTLLCMAAGSRRHTSASAHGVRCRVASGGRAGHARCRRCISEHLKHAIVNWSSQVPGKGCFTTERCHRTCG